MRFLILLNFILLALITTDLVIAGYDENSSCHVLENNTEQEDCEKTQISLLAAQLSEDQKSWKKSLSPKSKEQKLKRLDLTLSQQTSYLKHLEKKLNLIRIHREQLSKAQTVNTRSDDPKAREELGRALKNIGVKTQD